MCFSSSPTIKQTHSFPHSLLALHVFILPLFWCALLLHCCGREVKWYINDKNHTFMSSCSLRSFFELGSTMVRTSFSSNRWGKAELLQMRGNMWFYRRNATQSTKHHPNPTRRQQHLFEYLQQDLCAAVYLAWCLQGPAHSGKDWEEGWWHLFPPPEAQTLQKKRGKECQVIKVKQCSEQACLIFPCRWGWILWWHHNQNTTASLSYFPKVAMALSWKHNKTKQTKDIWKEGHGSFYSLSCDFQKTSSALSQS